MITRLQAKKFSVTLQGKSDSARSRAERSVDSAIAATCMTGRWPATVHLDVEAHLDRTVVDFIAAEYRAAGWALDVQGSCVRIERP